MAIQPVGTAPIPLPIPVGGGSPAPVSAGPVRTAGAHANGPGAGAARPAAAHGGASPVNVSAVRGLSQIAARAGGTGAYGRNGVDLGAGQVNGNSAAYAAARGAVGVEAALRG